MGEFSMGNVAKMWQNIHANFSYKQQFEQIKIIQIFECQWLQSRPVTDSSRDVAN